jgi:predicted nuclease of predicted toxin-antitoxin system
MRFLADQDVYQVTLEFLRTLGHHVLTAAELGMSRASDDDLLREATRQDRVFVTRDKDFGTLVFLQTQLSCGVILLRMSPPTMNECHAELRRVLSAYSDSEIRAYFWVVEPGQHRRRALRVRS